MSNIKETFKNYKVWICTNSVSNPLQDNGSLASQSYKTYKNIAEGRFMWINGANMLYGLEAFKAMLNYAINEIKDIDYILYIDDDCFFIGDEESLERMFLEFVATGSLVQGCCDGGCLCHRNHNPLMINTFVSFWNIAAIREIFDIEKDFKEIDALNVNESICNEPYINVIKETNLARNAWNVSAKLRKHKDCMYCDVVRNDPRNPIEPHQTPYSGKIDNFEPYYKLLQYYKLKTNRRISYFDCKDFEIPGIDPGISSEVMYEGNPVFVHTWFSRQYGRDVYHTQRIDAVIKNIYNR